MPLHGPARTYALAEGVDIDTLVSLVRARLTVEVDPPVRQAVTVFDTADRRVRDAGAELRLEPANGGPHLVLRDRPGNPPLAAGVDRSPRYLIDDIPTGPLRDRLAGAVEMRALLPLVTLTVETLPMRVLNRDDKTVVRLALTATSAVDLPSPAAGSPPIARLAPDHPANPGEEAGREPPAAPHEPTSEGGIGKPDTPGEGGGKSDAPGGGRVPPTSTGQPVALATRVEVAGVLGYDRALARVEALLDDELGLTEVPSGPADEAVVTLGGNPAGIRTKVAVRLRPSQPAAEAATAVLDDLARMVESNLPGTIEDLDTEFLHDLRVAVRRSRTVLRELRRAFPAEALARQRAALRWIQAVTGPTRDLDVQLLDWDHLVARLSQDQRAALTPVRDLVARHRAAAVRTLRRDLMGGELRRTWQDYRTFLGTAPGADSTAADPTGAPDAATPIARAAGRRIRRVYGRMLQLGAAIDGDSPATALHELRKRGKELRYLLELFGGLWPDGAVRPMVRRLKDLQDVLGRHQDREVQAGAMRALAPELAGVAGGAEALLSLGVLVDCLEREQREARAAFAERFTAFAADDRRTMVDRTFREPR